MHGVALVQAVDLPSRLDLHVPVDQDELADRLTSPKKRKKEVDYTKGLRGGRRNAIENNTDRVEHEAVDPLAGGDHHHGGAAVEGVAGRHQGPAGLQRVLLTRLIVRVLRGGGIHFLLFIHSDGLTLLPKTERCYLFVDGEDGPDGDEAVDVGGAVQRVEAHDVLPLEEKFTAESAGIIVFFSEPCGRPAPGLWSGARPAGRNVRAPRSAPSTWSSKRQTKRFLTNRHLKSHRQPFTSCKKRFRRSYCFSSF